MGAVWEQYGGTMIAVFLLRQASSFALPRESTVSGEGLRRAHRPTAHEDSPAPTAAR